MGPRTDARTTPAGVAIAGRARAALEGYAGDLFVVVLIANVVLERVVGGQSGAAIAVSATWGLPLLARRQLPVLGPSATLLLVGGTTFVNPALGQGTGGEILLTVAALWFLVADNSVPRALLGLPPLATAVATLAADLEELVIVGVVVLGCVVAAAVYRRDTGETAVLQDRAEELERTREASIRAAAVRERSRVARELHDIVGHSVSVMTVQAGAARMQLAHDIGLTMASVVAVEEASEAALIELTRLVDLLGEGEEVRGLDDMAALSAQMREVGLDVTLLVEGAPRPLVGGLDLALYRILQEALTNARKHAGPVPAVVRLVYDPEHVRLEVTNALSPRDSPPDGMPGHGLIGMRERATMYGGDVESRRTADSFVVEARVPAP